MKFLQKAMTATVQLFAALLFVAGFFDVEILGTLFGFGAGGGVVHALAAVAGGTVTEKSYQDASDDLLERDVDDIVVMYKPDRFPLTTMMQNQKSARGTSARKPEWVEVGYHARSTTTVGVTSAGSGGNAVTTEVDDVNMWGHGDLVYVPDVTVGSPATEFRGYVQSINTSNSTIDILPVNATDVPEIPDATSLKRMSRASAASDAQTPSHGAQGVLLWNYVQTFMGQFEIEKILESIDTYMDDFTVQQDLEMFDFRNSRENSRLFGPREKKFDSDKSEDIYTMGGVELFMGQSTTYTQGSISEDEWIDIAELVFAANAGSEERLVVGGKKFISSVLKVPSIQKQRDAKQTETVLGVNVRRVDTTFGDMLIKHHKGFDEMGREHDAFCLDMNHIRDLVLEPMQETELDLDKTGQKRVDATRLLESASIQTRYPDTHTMIKGVAGSGS